MDEIYLTMKLNILVDGLGVDPVRVILSVWVKSHNGGQNIAGAGYELLQVRAAVGWNHWIGVRTRFIVKHDE